MTDTQNLLAGQKALLRSKMAEVRAQIAAVKAQSAPAQAELDAAIAEQNALDAKIAGLAAQVDAIEQPQLHSLKLELSALAQAESAIKVAGADQASDASTAG
jgi:chromosome segregation ATPase